MGNFPLVLQFPIHGLDETGFHALRLPERALYAAAYFADVVKVEEEPRGSNRGVWVDRFLKSAHTDVGQPWCAAFVTFCLQQAGWDPFAHDLHDGVPEPAAVDSWAKFSRAANRAKGSPYRGRLFVIAGKGHTHIGFVSALNPDGSFQTIEGNSNDDGSREGYAVVRRTRTVSGVSGFIDLGGLE